MTLKLSEVSIQVQDLWRKMIVKAKGIDGAVRWSGRFNKGRRGKSRRMKRRTTRMVSVKHINTTALLPSTRMTFLTH